ncbi:MAG TPA: hypothetical protein VMC06_03775 [Opitutaceae bacterium]|nr:hypothetical protein [Opitutaceae bacterium]
MAIAENDEGRGRDLEAGIGFLQEAAEDAENLNFPLIARINADREPRPDFNREESEGTRIESEGESDGENTK